jgi:hypothetical protein
MKHDGWRMWPAEGFEGFEVDDDWRMWPVEWVDIEAEMMKPNSKKEN